MLVTGTRNVGGYFANEDEFGTVAEGKRADLVLLTENPLDDIGNVDTIQGVMVAGRWLCRAGEPLSTPVLLALTLAAAAIGNTRRTAGAMIRGQWLDADRLGATLEMSAAELGRAPLRPEMKEGR